MNEGVCHDAELCRSSVLLLVVWHKDLSSTITEGLVALFDFMLWHPA